MQSIDLCTITISAENCKRKLEFTLLITGNHKKSEILTQNN